MEEKTESLNTEALDFIFEYTKNAPEAQLKDVEALDNKVIQIVSVASIIIGLIGFVIGKSHAGFPSLIPLLIALVAYMALAIAAFFHLKAAYYRRSMQADILWDTFWKSDIKDIKWSLVADISKTYAFNKIQTNKKRRTLLVVVICAAVEVLGVGVFVILSVI